MAARVARHHHTGACVRLCCHPVLAPKNVTVDGPNPPLDVFAAGRCDIELKLWQHPTAPLRPAPGDSDELDAYAALMRPSSADGASSIDWPLDLLDAGNAGADASTDFSGCFAEAGTAAAGTAPSGGAVAAAAATSSCAKKSTVTGLPGTLVMP